jgi:hypothetical protein
MSDFIRDLIKKVTKIIRSSKEIRIHIRIRIRKILTDMDTIWLLYIRNRLFSYYLSISDIIRRFSI